MYRSQHSYILELSQLLRPTSIIHLCLVPKNSAVEAVTSGEIVILAAVDPDAVLVSVSCTGLEELRDIALVWRIALWVEAVRARLLWALVACLVKIGTTTNVGWCSISDAEDGGRVAIDKRHVAVGLSLAWEEALKLGATWAGVWLVQISVR